MVARVAMLAVLLAASAMVGMSAGFPSSGIDMTPFHARQSAPKGWEDAGFASDNQLVDVTFALKQQNLDVLEAAFWSVSDPDSPMYQKYLSPEAIADIVRPHDIHRDLVFGLLDAFQVERMIDLGDSVRARLTVSQAESMFATQFKNFVRASDGRTATKQIGQYSLPTAILEAVDFVSGISDFPVERESNVKGGDDNARSAYVVPQTLRAMYSVPEDHEVTSPVSQGPVEFQGDSSFNYEDLKDFFKQCGIKSSNITHVVGPFSGEYPDGEATLDAQFITGVASGNAQYPVNWYWTEENWMYDFATKFAATKNIPDVISISWGFSELDQCSPDYGVSCGSLGVDTRQYVHRTNVEFQKIGLRGTSILVSSGDSGANGRADPYCSTKGSNPSFPATSPFVTTVGATELHHATPLKKQPKICSDNGYTCMESGEERAVSVDVSSFTSGGGFSYLFPRPAYQDDAVKSYLQQKDLLPPTSFFNSSGRAIPDVAALGNGFLTLQSGLASPTGGTSASAPTVAALVTMINDKVGKKLGFLNPMLYKMAKEHPSAFHDVTKGNNRCTESYCDDSCNGYSCGKGFDAVTGLGTLNFAEIVKYLQSK